MSPEQKLKNVRTRIAPSPTGSPHIGTAYAALFNYCFTKKNQGSFILRIEDTDRTRFVESSEAEINKALEWLGLVPDESPEKTGEFGPYRQSERLDIYKKHVIELIAKNKAYYCDCSPERLAKVREEQQARGEVPRYDRKCRNNPPKTTEGLTVRLAVPLDGETIVNDLIRGEIVFENKNIDDQVLLKSDSFPTYHLASVVDDHLMQISHVIRAEEWLSSTPKHILLYHAFGWEEPKFAHLPLLRNRDRSKISKRKNPVAIEFYQDQGYLPEALLNFLGTLGWSMPDDQEIFTLEEMISHFDFSRVDPAGPIFDIEKLDWLNGEYIRKLSDEELSMRLVAGKFTKIEPEKISQILPLIKERLKKLSEFDSLTSYFFEEVKANLELLAKVSQHPVEETITILNGLLEQLNKISETDWKKEKLEEIILKQQADSGWSKTEYLQTVRVAVTASNQTPPLFDVLEALGKDKVVTRLQTTSEALVE